MTRSTIITRPESFRPTYRITIEVEEVRTRSRPSPSTAPPFCITVIREGDFKDPYEAMQMASESLHKVLDDLEDNRDDHD